MKFRVIDIETIPDLSVWTPGESKWTMRRGVKDDGHRTLLAWFSANDEASVCEVTYVEESPFPPPQAHRVVAIAHVDIDMDISTSPRYRCMGGSSACSWSVDDENADMLEKALLERFSNNMVWGEGEAIELVTWNGRGFDLPVLSMRSLKHGIPFEWYYAIRDMRYRYSTTGHLDLMDFLADYGAAKPMKLGDAARLIGLPGKTDMTGASVHDMVRASRKSPHIASEKMDEVGRYCWQDAIQTALIFLRTRFHLGKINKDEYNHSLDTFVQSDFIKDVIDINWDKMRL
jgi:predicted PolB exonuclease-like 3'-5' exonuclease